MHRRRPSSFRPDQSAFTLIEIAVVVSIIGILAVLAMPYFKRATDSSAISTLENDLRIFAQEFNSYELSVGSYPVSQTTAGVYPIGMEERMSYSWRLPSVIGGTYRWINSGNSDPNNIFAYIEINTTSSETLRIDPARLSEVDDDIVDGNLNTGKLQTHGLSIRYYLRQ
jgi:prepilin-type N-terminal cleavage/methylation domain-containing protein